MSHEHKTCDAGSPQRARVLVGLWRFVRRFFFAQRAHREAVYLARVMWRRSYRDRAPHWQPLDDTAGVISQIDNMHAGSLAEIDRAQGSESALEREVQAALEAIPSEFLGNDAWQNGIVRMAAEIKRLREPNSDSGKLSR